MTSVNCCLCHPSVGSPKEYYPANWPFVNEPYSHAEAPTVDACMVNCHFKDRAKRGFQETNDVHIVDEGMLCQDCHYRDPDDPASDHMLLKGYAIDTSEPTSKGSMYDEGTDCESCHLVETGDPIHTNNMLNQHAEVICCETCHTGIRPAGVALNDRSWQHVGGALPVTHKRMVEWLPWLKWYDGGGPPPGYPAYNSLPILNDPDLMKTWSRVFNAKICPFNNIEVTWWLKDGSIPQPSYDDIIPNCEVKAADTPACGGNGDGTTSTMTGYDGDVAGCPGGDGVPGPDYPNSILITDTVCFNVSHSVQAKEDAFYCNDCHGDGEMGRYADGWAEASGTEKNTWEDLGYSSGDPLPGTIGTTIEDLAMSYHGHLGHLLTADVTDEHDGMLEKW